MNSEDITKIQYELKIKLPDSYKKVIHSYPFGKESFGYTCMLANDIEAIIAMNKASSLHSAVHMKNITDHPCKNETLFWIGNDGGEEEYCLDISQEAGAIYKLDLETGEFTEYAHDLNCYIERIHEIDQEIDNEERKSEERRKNAKWWEFWKRFLRI